jgi:hypothetical protein
VQDKGDQIDVVGCRQHGDGRSSFWQANRPSGLQAGPGKNISRARGKNCAELFFISGAVVVLVVAGLSRTKGGGK